jgi:protein-tyrosine phosphatase
VARSTTIVEHDRAARPKLSMRQINDWPLWLGNAYEVRDLRIIHAAEIAAVVDLSLNEPPLAVTRELIYCRFPLLDGTGNPPWLLRLAAQTVAEFLRQDIRTLVFCSAGMSRTPVIAAAAISLLQGKAITAILEEIVRDGPADVSPALLSEVTQAIR